MRLSTRGRYALRAMVDLAAHRGAAPVQRSDIAQRQEISADYIEQLFVKLRRAELIRSVKGPGGGYVLARDPATISAGDIIAAVEGPLAVVHCVTGDQDEPCHRIDRCVAHLLWKKLSATLSEILDSTTLKDLCDQSAALEGTSRDTHASTDMADDRLHIL